MKKLYLVLAFAVTATLVTAGPAAAQRQDPRQTQAAGGLQVTVHSHSNDDPDWPGLLFPTDRLSFDFVQGEDFSYSSRTCGGPAPFNDVGLDFTPDYPGVDDDDGTAPVRHHVEGTVTEVRGRTGTIEGTITMVLCEPGPPDAQGRPTQVETEHSIVMHFTARYMRVSDNELRIVGRFQISPTESTGTFAGLEGRGSIQGSFTCLAHQRNPSQPTCAQRGHFTDFVAFRGDPRLGPGELRPGIVGSYRDTSVLTA